MLIYFNQANLFCQVKQPFHETLNHIKISIKSDFEVYQFIGT